MVDGPVCTGWVCCTKPERDPGGCGDEPAGNGEPVVRRYTIVVTDHEIRGLADMQQDVACNGKPAPRVMQVVDVVGQCHRGRVRRLVNNQHRYITHAVELLEMCDPLRQALGPIACRQANAYHGDTAQSPGAAVNHPAYQHTRSHAYPNQ